jgi:hypothetical protein
MPKTVSDQPGRCLAVLLVSPLLVAAGILLTKYPESAQRPVSIGIIVFGIVLFFYDGYWLIARPPERTTIGSM